MPPTNARTRWLYTIYAPFYDAIGGILVAPRRRSIELLALRPGERLLLVGAGTGLDLPHVPGGVRALATDLTPAMLARARQRPRPGTLFCVMDGHGLALPDASFDAVALHLIVAVIPDPVACLREASRVLAPGGRIAVFDKFVREGQTPSLPRRLANVVLSALASDITRTLEPIVAAADPRLRIVHDEPAAFGDASESCC